MPNKKHCKWYLVCPMRRFTEAGMLDSRWVEEYCLVGNRSCVRYQLEAAGKPHPDNMLPNGEIDESLPPC
jgi:hypothetical protein